VFVSVSWTAPGCAELVTRNTSFGGLKKVMRLEVSDADDTVTSDALRDRPGTANGPRLKQVPSLSGLHCASDEHGLRVMQLAPRTT